MDVMKPVAAAAIGGIIAWWAAQTSITSLAISILFAGTVGVFVYLMASWLLRAEGCRMVFSKISGKLAKKFGRRIYGDQ